MSQAGLWIFPAIALVLFLAVFVAVVARTFTKRFRKEGEEAAQLPLADDAPLAPAPINTSRPARTSR
jgi:cbb3-type cytochrome oxidase subunit 3